MRKLFFILIIVLSLNKIQAQEYNYARLSVLYGGNIPFNFNSIEKYRTGIEIVDGTILGITLADSSQAGVILEGFELNIRTFNGATSIRGDAYDLALDRIQIRASNYLGLIAGTSFGYLDLSPAWITLFRYTNIPFTDLSWDSHQLSLSYGCGIPVSEGGNGTLLGEEPDYYHVELEVEIMPIGQGF